MSPGGYDAAAPPRLGGRKSNADAQGMSEEQQVSVTLRHGQSLGLTQTCQQQRHLSLVQMMLSSGLVL